MVRSSWKGPFIDTNLYEQIMSHKKTHLKSKIKVWSRRSIIIPESVGLTFEVHNGKRFSNIYISEDMVGHKFGEFSLTRKGHKYKEK